MQTIIFLQGLPGSGKTTFAKEWVKQSDNRVRINMDDLRNMSGDYQQFLTDPYIKQAETTLLELALLNNKDVIVDATNFKVELEKEKLRYPNYHVMVVTVNTPIEECIRRDALRPSPVGAEVIKGMAFKYGLITQEQFDNL